MNGISNRFKLRKTVRGWAFAAVGRVVPSGVVLAPSAAGAGFAEGSVSAAITDREGCSSGQTKANGTKQRAARETRIGRKRLTIRTVSWCVLRFMPARRRVVVGALPDAMGGVRVGGFGRRDCCRGRSARVIADRDPPVRDSLIKGLAGQAAVDPDGRAKFTIDGFLVGAALGRGIGRGYRVT